MLMSNFLDLKKIPFLNASENGYYHLYGKNYQISGEISITCQSLFIIFKIIIIIIIII